MSGDSLGELKVNVAIDLDVAAAHAQQAKAADDAVATHTAAAEQVEGVWGQAAQARAETDTATQRESADEAVRVQGAAADATSSRWSDAASHVKTALAGALVAGAAAVGVFLHSTMESGLAIDRQARSIGMSTDEVQRWRYVAEQAGLAGNDLGEAVGGFAQRANQAAESGGDAAQRFADMGISLRDANGGMRPLNDLMLDAADHLQQLGPGTEQTATAIALFGEKGRQLLPVLGRGRAGVEALGAEFDALGGGLDANTIATMAELDRETNRIKASFMGALMPAVREVFDWMKKLADQVRPAIEQFREMTANSHLVRAGLISLGAVAAGVAVAVVAAFWPVIATFVLVGGAAVAFGLLVDDIITTFEGGSSVIRRFVDGIFGIGATTQMVQDAKDTFEGLTEAIGGVGGAGAALEGAFTSFLIPLGLTRDSVAFLAEWIPKLLRYATPLGQLASLVGGAARERGAASRHAREGRQEQATARAEAGFGRISGGTGERLLTATPAQAVVANGFRVDQAGGGRGALTVANHSRVNVQISGMLDPTSAQFANAVGGIVTTALEQQTQDTAETVTRGRGS
jgi:TP901 family phage tail tape measure protein